MSFGNGRLSRCSDDGVLIVQGLGLSWLPTTTPVIGYIISDRNTCEVPFELFDVLFAMRECGCIRFFFSMKKYVKNIFKDRLHKCLIIYIFRTV